MALTITRNRDFVSVNDGVHIRVHACKSVEAAVMLEAQLKADLTAARLWLYHKPKTSDAKVHELLKAIAEFMQVPERRDS
ncbi:MAG: hypothetical protein WCF85_11565 [Rhodospirillaceae bacterium]